jgi:hypothetical protein
MDRREWKDVPIPKWVKRSPREMMMGAHWPEGPEDWREWHEHGLQLIIVSGRISSSLFTDPPTRDGNRVLATFMDHDYRLPWAYRLAAYLLAGVGTEYLLKSLYIKAGYSLRNPDRPMEKAMAKHGTPEAQWYNPRRSVSFGTMLRDQNLRLICADPVVYKPLGLAKWWRDEPGHAPVVGSADAGVYYAALGASLRTLHNNLMKEAGEGHQKAIQKILTETRTIYAVGEGTQERRRE